MKLCVKLVGKRAEIGYRQLFAANITLKTALNYDLGKSFLADLGKSRHKRVGESLSSLLKSRLDGSEEGRFMGRLYGLILPKIDTNHA